MTTRNTKATTITTAALIAALSFTLAACSSSDAPAPAPTTPAATQSTAPVEDSPAEDAPEAPAPAAVGDVVTAEQAEALPAGQRAYEMADGSLVVIDDAAPLPEAVRAEMIAPIVELSAQFPGLDHGDLWPLQKEIGAVVAAYASDGRDFYVIFPYEADAGTFYTAFGRDGTGLFNGVMSKDEAIRLAQEQADRINNAERRLGEFIEVIVP